MESIDDIKAAAAQWIARRSSETWSTADEAELEQWLNASTRNLIAYLRLQAVWQQANRLNVLGAGFERGVVPGVDDFRASPFFQRVSKQSRASGRMVSVARSYRALAAMASVLMVIASGAWYWTASHSGKSYSTPIGVTAAVPLPDGSKITLNTNSEVRVAVTERARKVELKQGEAFFEVAKDAGHPFVVHAGDKNIIVVGTKFSVLRMGKEVRVVVTEGRVRVEQDQPGAQTPSTQLSAGSVARSMDGSMAIQEHTLPDAEEMLSWLSGYIVFHETSLADAAAEFNRYNTVEFVIDDPSVAALTISGNFRATNIDSFVGLIERGLPVAVARQGDRIVLTRRASPRAAVD